MPNLPALSSQRGTTIVQLRKSNPSYTSDPEDLLVSSTPDGVTHADTIKSVVSNAVLSDGDTAIDLVKVFEDELGDIAYEQVDIISISNHD